MKTRLRGIRLLAAASIAAGLTVTAAGSATAHECGGTPQSVETFHVELTTARTTYRPGETIRIRVEVSKHSQTADDGHEPVEGASVSADLQVKGAKLQGPIVRTDEDGKAAVTIKLARNAPTGAADAHAYAYKTLTEVCHHKVDEWGAADVANFIRIAKR